MKIKNIIIVLLILLLAVNVVIGDDNFEDYGEEDWRDFNWDEADAEAVDEYEKFLIDNDVRITNLCSDNARHLKLKDGKLTIEEDAKDVEFHNLPEETTIEEGANIKVGDVEISSNQGNLETRGENILVNKKGGEIDVNELRIYRIVESITYKDGEWVLEYGDGEESIEIDGEVDIDGISKTDDGDLNIDLGARGELIVPDGTSVKYERDDDEITLTINNEEMPPIEGVQDGARIEVKEEGPILVDHVGILDYHNTNKLESIELGYHADNINKVTYSHEDGHRNRILREDGLGGQILYWGNYEGSYGAMTVLPEDGTLIQNIPGGENLPTSELKIRGGGNFNTGIIEGKYVAGALNDETEITKYTDPEDVPPRDDTKISLKLTEEVRAGDYDVEGDDEGARERYHELMKADDDESDKVALVAEDINTEERRSIRGHYSHDLNYGGEDFAEVSIPGAKSYSEIWREGVDLVQEIKDVDVTNPQEGGFLGFGAPDDTKISGTGRAIYRDNEIYKFEDLEESTSVTARGTSIRLKEGMSELRVDDNCGPVEGNCISPGQVKIEDSFIMKLQHVKQPFDDDKGILLSPDGGGPTIYRVQYGDTLNAIAERYGVSVEELREWNDIDEGDDLIHPGDEIIIIRESDDKVIEKDETTAEASEDGRSIITKDEESETKTRTEQSDDDAEPDEVSRGEVYTVRSGDTVHDIAERAGTSVDTILAFNDIEDEGDLIHIGDEIHIPSEFEEDVGTTLEDWEKEMETRLWERRMEIKMDEAIEELEEEDDQPDVTELNLQPVEQGERERVVPYSGDIIVSDVILDSPQEQINIEPQEDTIDDRSHTSVEIEHEGNRYRVESREMWGFLPDHRTRYKWNDETDEWEELPSSSRDLVDNYGMTGSEDRDRYEWEFRTQHAPLNRELNEIYEEYMQNNGDISEIQKQDEREEITKLFSPEPEETIA